MDFDDEMSGLQIEDLGEYFLQTDIGDSWKGFSLGYNDEEKSVAPSAGATGNNGNPLNMNFGKSGSTTGAATATSTIFSSSSTSSAIPLGVTSPPLSSFSEMFKSGNYLGVGLGFGSPSRPDFTLSPALMNAITNPGKNDQQMAVMNKHAVQDAMELSNFSLDSLKKPAQGAAVAEAKSSTASSCSGMMMKPATGKSPSPTCQSILGGDQKLSSTTKKSESVLFGGVNAKRSFDMVDESCSFDSCATIGAPEDDRGFRKKSREKMRRQEVNVKFEELVELLGLSNRVRKSAILQEAVSAIKMLKREREEMRRDRDRLQHEVSKLATCLQYTHLGSVAAANAVAMTQVQNPFANHMNPASAATSSQALSHMNHSQPSNAGFPIGSGFGTLPGNTQVATLNSSSGSMPPIAPKQNPKMGSTTSFTPIAPDMK